jgi:hypothetical protein
MRALFRSASALVVLANCGGTVEPTGGGPAGQPGPTPSSTPAPRPPTPTPTASSTPPSPPIAAVDICVDVDGSSLPFAFPSASTGVDYVELRDDPYEVPTEPGMPTVKRQLVGQSGTPCASASDAAACKNKLAAITANAGWDGYAGGQFAPARRYFAYTRGNEVGVATDLAGFRTVFGAVDTLEEAALIATLQDYRLKCDGPHAWREGSTSRLRMLHATDWTCPSDAEDRMIRVGADGAIEIISQEKNGEPFGCAGRRFEGFAPTASDARSVGEWLAQTAQLEAASVPAFERLARELAAHGAPKRLVLAAERAREDEVRHAAAMTAHALRHGASVSSIAVPALPVRPLLEIAIENAVEGCVREAFAALVAHFQAARAATPALRETFAKIAEDETRHAALAHDCDEWLLEKLTPAERARVFEARARALRDLRVDLVSSPDPVSARVLGLPDATSALTLLALVEPTLAAA